MKPVRQSPVPKASAKAQEKANMNAAFKRTVMPGLKRTTVATKKVR